MRLRKTTGGTVRRSQVNGAYAFQEFTGQQSIVSTVPGLHLTVASVLKTNDSDHEGDCRFWR